MKWDDLLKGEIDIDLTSLSDPVLFREDGVPLYTFSSAVDDIDYGITHVIRGDDHTSNTAVQIELINALDKNNLVFAHHALLKASSGDKLSKRDNVISIESFRDLNIEPLAILSLLATIGTSNSIELKDSIEQIKEGASFNKNTLYLGPGTGLGAAISIDNKTVLSTEIGNTTNSTKYLMENYNIESEDLLTLEDVISGTAISSIYKLKTGLSISSEEILEKYQEEEPISVEVINNFIKSLAQLLSDLALTFNTGNGILLAGSLMRSLYPLICLLYTSPSPRDKRQSRMPSSA